MVSFGEKELPEAFAFEQTEKNITDYLRTKSALAQGASAYEFLKQGCQTSDVTMGAGYTVRGGESRQVVTKSDLTAKQALLVNEIVLTYTDGAYPPADAGDASAAAGNGLTAGGSCMISGKVLAVAGTDVQVEFSDGTAGGVRWIPYCSMLGNDIYCMPDQGDTVYCYYENDGTVLCLGSRRIDTGGDDFTKPDERVFTANNRMIRLKKDGVELTGNRAQMDGAGGDEICIRISDSDGVSISATKEIQISADRTLLIQANDLEKVKKEPTAWFDSEREERMKRFDQEQTAGMERYVADGGNDSYNAAWDLTKTLGGNLIGGFWEDVKAPFQLISTIGDMINPPEAPEEPPKLSFDKVDEYQVMIFGMDSCTLQVPGFSCVRFAGESIVISGPNFRWFGFHRITGYPQESESQQTLMDAVLDVVQVGIDLIGLIPGCNVVCGALNAGISLLRGDYYGVVSGIIGMACPGGGLASRAIGMVADASQTTKKVIKTLKVLKAGALITNAGLLGSEDLKEIARRWSEGELEWDDPDDIALFSSLLRNFQTAAGSAKDIDSETRKRTPKGDDTPAKKQGDTDDPRKASDEAKKKAKSSGQKPENEVCDKDPIDVVTGSQKIMQTELVIKDVAEDFRLLRTYQSIHTNEGGLLGSKWYLSVESWLTVEGQTATVILPDMHLEHFKKEETGWSSKRNGDRTFFLTEADDGYCLAVAQERKKYIYNRAGRLVRIVDRNGNTTWFRYVGKRLSEVQFAGGQYLRFAYEDGKVASITDVIGRTMKYRYDGELLTEAEYPNMGTMRYTYTPEGYIRTVTDQNGHTYVENAYDFNGRVIRQLLANGQEYLMLYDDSRRVNTFLTPSTGKRMEYHYNKDKLLTKTVYTDGSFEERGYDNHQNLSLIRDRRGMELRRSFGERGELLEETLPNGLVTRYAYDEAGLLLREWDNAGRIREFSYDKCGNCLQLRTAIDETHWQEIFYTYDKKGRMLSVTDPRGGQTFVSYEKDGVGMASYQTAEGYVWSYAYDPAGRCMLVQGEESRLDYAYNHMDYPVRVTDALGHTTKYRYDHLCNLTKRVLPNQYDRALEDGVGTEYVYDEMDELICRIDPLGNVFATPRDLEENISREIHPVSYDPKTGEGDGIRYVYDAEDRRIRIHYPDGGTERIRYDAAGNITKKTAPEQYDKETDDGPGYCYDYDCVNRLVQITDPQGQVVRRYVYDLCGNIVKEVDAAGYLAGTDDENRIGTLYTYNTVGWLVAKREPARECEGEVCYRLTEYVHDAAGNMTKERRYLEFQTKESRTGAVHTISYAYDKDNRRTCVSDSTGAAIAYRYNSRNQCVRERRRINDGLFLIHSYGYDKGGRLIQAVVSEETAEGVKETSRTRYEYDKNGNCTHIRLPEGGEIRREYDAADRLILEEHAEKKSGIQNRTEFSYDAAGNLTEIRDRQGRKTVIAYDLSNREIRRTEKDGSVTRSFYHGNGQLAKLVRPNQYDAAADDGVGYVYTYDMQGRIRTVVGPDGHVLTCNTYDADGHVIRRQDGTGAGAVFSYDMAGNRTGIRTAGGSAQTLIFDARGNIIGVEDGNSNRTAYVLDAWGRITEIQKPDGSKEKYAYDCAGNMISATDGEGHTTAYTYDSRSNLTAIIDPMGGRETYIYDKEGRLSEKTDRNGITTSYGFNIYGAPLYRRVKNGTAGDFYEYTPEGLLRSAISQSETGGGMRYSYAYDAMDRVIRKAASGRTLLTFAYDGNGNCVRQSDVTGKVTEYRFDDLDRMSEVWDDGGELAAYAYGVNGRIMRESHGALEKEYFYDVDQNLTGLRIHAGASLLVDHHYAYDGNGNRTLKKQLEGEIKYHFDPLNRLHQVEYPSYCEALFYDKAGNRTRRVLSSSEDSNRSPMEELYRYDAGNHLIELVKQGSVTSFAYDAAGNLLQDDRAVYTYDDFYRTVKAETFDGNIQINDYDAEGLRHEMEENGRLVQFIFNTEREVVTETEGNVTNRLIRGSALIARTTDAECARTYYHYASDEMGSITHLTDADGKVLNRYGYDAWGVSVVCEEQVENRFRYTGEQFDAITKQYYLRARFYNPVIARFTQEDTYRGDGLNLYAYCANNPVGYVDPSGHQPQCVKDAAAKYMAEGLGKEEAYRKAYQNHAKQKLANAASLPVQERIKLEERARRLGLEVDSSVNREKNPEAKTPDAEQRDKGGSRTNNYDQKIKWGIHDIEVRKEGNGFWGRRIEQKNSRVDQYELKINPQNESYYLPHPEGGYVQFENMVDSTVQDGKLIMKQKSFYHIDGMPNFAKNKVLQEAERQLTAANTANYKVEWLVSEQEAAEQLRKLFKNENMDIKVNYYPE